ncbi:hypothetical protein LUX57_32435 [Actinomadura madurae]|uniref:hypothetical protein n=1 Tax=Actinomadura madurae TaxID=1993 RepID=UPI0020D24FD4|nr:hypothetical protein [Actinomadura madurae]MCP9969306.1 hypothetical protein [Actinomadura madurae]
MGSVVDMEIEPVATRLEAWQRRIDGIPWRWRGVPTSATSPPGCSSGPSGPCTSRRSPPRPASAAGGRS